MTSQTANSLLSYIEEQVGAYTVPGPHHRDTGSQDSFWPSSSSGDNVLGSLNRRDVAQHGRLYILADGVSLCADGKQASTIAVETAGNYYYQTASAYPNTDQGRLKRLEDAAWQAHLRVSAWDERFFCWRAESHADGVAHHFKREQLSSLKPPICPLCSLPVVGLQTTFLAALVRGQQLLIVGIGDCSAYRLPANPEHGAEWIFPPQDGQFCGMPSLTREAIVGQSFIMTPGDSVLLASDGMVKVLDGLHENAGWHAMLRERLVDDYNAQVEEMILDLDGWRLSKPRQRKLHDDLTLVAMRLSGETAIKQTSLQSTMTYDSLVELQKSQALSAADFEDYLHITESALVDDADPQLWQLYGTALHSHALLKVAESANWQDEGLTTLLRQSSVVSQQGGEWVTAQRRLGQLTDIGEMATATSESHMQITSDLYSADWQSAPPALISRVMAAVKNVLDTVNDRSPWDAFLSYLSGVDSAEKSKLPARSAIIAPSHEEENIRALELQITQAISNGQWENAQELIIELNKLKGATLNFDTEGVDTSPTRPVRQATPVARASSHKAAATIAPRPNGNGATNELVMPFERIQRVFHSRESDALVRDAAHAAFSTKSEHFDPGMAADLMSEADKLYPDLTVTSDEWKALWANPNAEFELHKLSESGIGFSEISRAMAVARDLSLVNERTRSLDLKDLHKSEAKEQQVALANMQPVVESPNLLPFRLGQGAWWYASSLNDIRLHLPQARDLIGRRDALSPLDTARLDYAEGQWNAILAQQSGEALNDTFYAAARTSLSKVEASNEQPWNAAAEQLLAALAHPHTIVRAFYVDQLPAVETADKDESMRLTQLKAHFVAAAWEMTFAMAENRIGIDRKMLEEVRTQLVNAPFDVTGLDGANGIRLNTIYNLLGMLIHDSDGAIVNGFYAYELKVPRRLSENDFRRLAALRDGSIRNSWRETLAMAATKQPFYLPPGGQFVSRVKPDKATPEGRRLQAVRALLPHLSQSWDNWLEYALFVYRWEPPTALSAEDQLALDDLVDGVVNQAWHSTLSAISGDVVQNLSAPHVEALREDYGELILNEDSSKATTRMRAIQQLLPLILRIKERNTHRATLASEARRAYNQLSDELHDDDRNDLDTACDVPVETLWQFSVDAVRDLNSADIGAVTSEHHALSAIDTLPTSHSGLWEAITHILGIAIKRREQARLVADDDTSQELFKAFRSINIEGDRAAMLDKTEDLYQLSYEHLVEWKDSLPVNPGLLTRRRVNAEKRRIQEYWLLRKEYGM